MYRKCVTEISVRHQHQVEEALLDMMRKMPYEEITVTALCQAAGVSRRVFYHLFNSKTGALYAMLDHIILASGSYSPETGDQALRSLCYWKDHRHLLDALQESQLTGLLLERMVVCILSEEFDLRYWLKANGWEAEKDVIIFYLSGFMGLIFRWYYSGFRESPEEMAVLLNRILTVPLARH